MPLQYKSYGCQFKCGRNHSEKLQAIIKHEATCYKNPEFKTCLTCAYQEAYWDGCDHPERPGCPSERWFVRMCDLPEGDDLIESKLSELKTETGWVKPIVQCPFHQLP